MQTPQLEPLPGPRGSARNGGGAIPSDLGRSQASRIGRRARCVAAVSAPAPDL